ncbi:MAG TPA: MGMT family protein [Candidatus Paceibacterota bacterium]
MRKFRPSAQPLVVARATTAPTANPPAKPCSRCIVPTSKNSFRERVLAVVKKIPEGETMTYGQVARLASSPRAARAVGNILHTNYDPAIPCHRVVHANGTLGGYNRGQDRKRALLHAEGAYVPNERNAHTSSQRIRRAQDGGGRRRAARG